jgi:hypothetical protein
LKDKENRAKFDVAEAMVITTAAVEQEQELARTGSAWLDCFEGSDGRRTLIICMVYTCSSELCLGLPNGRLSLISSDRI